MEAAAYALWVPLILGVLVILAVIGLITMAVALKNTRSRLREVEETLETHPALDTERVPHRPHQVGVVINDSKSESQRMVSLITAECRAAGIPAPQVLPSTPEDPGYAMAREAVESGCDVVIAVGGDGTVRAVATELLNTQVELAVIPLGTGNLFARNIGLPHQDLRSCAAIAIHGGAERIDAVNLEVEFPGGERRRETSLVIAGAGLDAEVMSDTRASLKQHAGWLAYGEAGLRHMTGPRKTVDVSFDADDTRSFTVRSLLLANCGALQAGMVLVPSARYNDGLLDTMLFTPRNGWDWARIIGKTVLRLSSEVPVITSRQSRSTRVTMAEPMQFQIDGDPLGEISGVVAQIEPHAIAVRTNAAPQYMPTA